MFSTRAINSINRPSFAAKSRKTVAKTKKRTRKSLDHTKRAKTKYFVLTTFCHPCSSTWKSVSPENNSTKPWGHTQPVHSASAREKGGGQELTFLKLTSHKHAESWDPSVPVRSFATNVVGTAATAFVCAATTTAATGGGAEETACVRCYRCCCCCHWDT